MEGEEKVYGMPASHVRIPGHTVIRSLNDRCVKRPCPIQHLDRGNDIVLIAGGENA